MDKEEKRKIVSKQEQTPSEDSIDAILSEYTLRDLQSMRNEIVPGKVLLFHLAKDLLSEPPDDLAAEVARELFRDQVDELLGYGMSEPDILREIAEMLLRVMPDEQTAAKKSKEFLHEWEILPTQYKQMVERVEELRARDLEMLLTSFPLLQKFEQDCKIRFQQPPTPADDGAGEDNIRVPQRLKDLTRWRATWGKVKAEWRKARSYKAISEWLGKMHPDLACSPETLADIIRAGEAGRLD